MLRAMKNQNVLPDAECIYGNGTKNNKGKIGEKITKKWENGCLVHAALGILFQTHRIEIGNKLKT